ncbi:DUF6446 family protein [Oceaniovalibus sp. ACAM 378]|uniref:DUF6446 family protein n=1 Tax=Oceaniovalibus sp. ACAM 378 TaxID=2599923 RepID=UPI0011D39CB1|nr:DUF6446 family protein [Oceaniovalibus sp. ACAM 378]TYB91192.1 histidine kinase [Oceaniovalibus sp. ACAM 378]
MNGKFIGGFIVITALVAGAAMYWLQVYGFYDTVDYQPDSVVLTVLATETPEPILAENFQGIDADSSPLRFRACFTTPMSQAMLTETYVTYPVADPLVAPSWFKCFDAAAIGAALETGEAIAFLGQANIEYGVDRVVAVFDDGRAFVWHQLNNCGDTLYDGSAAGPACPTRDGG